MPHSPTSTRRRQDHRRTAAASAMSRRLPLLALTLLGCGSEPAPSGSELAASQAQTIVPGFAELHFHMMAQEGFGGAWLHGTHEGPQTDCDGGLPPSDHARLRQNLLPLLTTCNQSLAVAAATGGVLAPLFANGGAVASEFMGKVEGTEGDTGLHLGRKSFPSGWPRWDSFAHHQGHTDWLKKAHDGGLNVVMISAVSFDWLCNITPADNRTRPECDEMKDIDVQLELAHQFAAKNASWAAIARSPAEAREIAASGKLAILLSIETSHLFGRDVNASNLQERFDRYYNMGVRSFLAVHEVDNAFGGASTHQEVLQFAQYTENCHVDTDCKKGLTGPGVTLGFDVDSNCKNTKGLTPLGARLFHMMMDKGLLIDLSHLSERATEDVFNLAVARQYYPLIISHGHFREIMSPKVAGHEKSTPAHIVKMIRNTGGIFGLRTAPEETKTYLKSAAANSCHGSSRSFAQAYEFGAKGLKVPMAFGSDLNGFTAQTRPRFGPNGACSAGFEAEAECQARDESQSGPGRLGTEFDEKGLAHIGLLPDLLADLKKLRVFTAGNIGSSAEVFLRVWERAHGTRTGPADLALDMDVGSIADYADVDARKATYPQQCGEPYCAAVRAIGDECNSDGQCASNRCTDVACGTLNGRCTCDEDADCGAQSWCNLDIPITGLDNRCSPKKADHQGCNRDTQCASGHCGGFLFGSGWCYTPGSKAVDQGCRADPECRSNRCADVFKAQLCRCNDQSDCSAGQFCGWGGNAGSCVDKRAKGKACTKDVECQSNNCNWRFVCG